MNLFKNIFFILILSVAFQVIAQAQQSAIHLNKPYYVTGEVLRYAFYPPSAMESKTYKVKVKIVASNGVIIDDYFLQHTPGQNVSGYFKVPFDVASDIYSLQFFAADAGSFEEASLGAFDVGIYNDLTASETYPVASKDQSVKEGQLNVTVDVPDFIRGGTATNLKISVTDASGKTVKARKSIAIFDESVHGAQGSNHLMQVSDATIVENPTNSIYAKGIVKSEGTPVQINVLGAYNGTTQTMEYAKTNKSGGYTLDVGDFKGELPFQFLPYIFEEYMTIDVVPERLSAAVSEKRMQPSAEILNYLTQSRLRKKIYQAYKTTESDLKTEPIEYKVKPLKSNTTFKIKEYQSFKNMAAFFNELLNSNLEFLSQKDTTFKARMYNPEARGLVRHFTGEPIFIIDDKITKDATFIGTMSLDNIETAELFYITKEIRKNFGTFGSRPFVKITTSVPDILVPADELDDIFTFKGIQPTEMSTGKAANNAPNLRPDVFWDANAGTNVNFKPTMDRSNFAIQVLAITDDGRIGMTKVNYVVGDNQ